MELDIKRTPIEDKIEFNRIGYHYKRVWSDNEKKVYVYKLEHLDSKIPYYQFEVVKGAKKGDIYTYPSDEQFGVYAWYICGTSKICNQKISQKLSNLLNRYVKFECEGL